MTTTEHRDIKRCPTCTTTRPDPVYCAPARCYCGHPDCPAFASYYKPNTVIVTAVRQGDTSTWDERDRDDKGGWIDRM